MIAVIDCGTNTFNLLIAKLCDNNSLEIIYNGKIPVKLGEGGINKNTISPPAFARGLDAIKEFYEKIKTFPVTTTIAIGTAAIRDAKNGKDFINSCKLATTITIELIDGNREAELIWLAAKNCVNTAGKFLLMDIGGGSNEFVIADNNKIYWKKSYRLGLSRLKEIYKLDNNPPPDHLKALEIFLKDEMHELFEACLKFNTTLLIGTAGTFDTYANVFTLLETKLPFDFSNKTYAFNTSSLLQFCSTFVYLPFDERNSIAGIPDFRKEFMLYACMLTKVVMENCKIQESSLSSYALKEGVFLAHL